nr:PREDICTED: protein FAM210B [Opisthocomus hoazin]
MANIAGKEVPLQQSLKRMRLVLTVLTSQILLLLHHIYARNNFLLQLQRELTGTSKTLHAKCFYLIVSFVKDAGVSPEKAAMDSSGETKKLNKSQQLKQVFKEYGAVGVSFHVGISLVSLGIFYLAVSSGVDMTAVLFKLGFSESSLQCKMAAGTSTFVLAYAIHKLFAPVRISITIVSVPFIVRYCRKIGFFKPPAPNP